MNKVTDYLDDIDDKFIAILNRTDQLKLIAQTRSIRHYIVTLKH